jgi:hypothetical protein
MNNLFKGLFVTAFKLLIFSVLCIVFLITAFANVVNKQNNGTATMYAHKLQAVSNTAAVLQKCLNMPELRQYFPKKPQRHLKKVYAMQSPVIFFSNNAVSKFQSVSFEQREAIYADKADGFFMLTSFSTRRNTAALAFYYHYSYTAAPANVEGYLSPSKNRFHVGHQQYSTT